MRFSVESGKSNTQSNCICQAITESRNNEKPIAKLEAKKKKKKKKKRETHEVNDNEKYKALVVKSEQRSIENRSTG